MGVSIGAAIGSVQPNAEVEVLQIALKTVALNAESENLQMARNEIEVFQRLNTVHPNLLPLLFGADTGTELVLLTPYAPGGDLQDLTGMGHAFKCLEEADAGGLFSQMLAGLIALHSVGFVHCDVKPANVFLTEIGGLYRAQLGDFGLTRYVEPGSHGFRATGGTFMYIAPEAELASESLISFPADLFAVGVMCYQLLSAMSPLFESSGHNGRELLFEENCWRSLTPAAREFVKMLLATDPEARGTAQSAAGHAWFEAAVNVQRGLPRNSRAPKPDTALRFHTFNSIWELLGGGWRLT